MPESTLDREISGATDNLDQPVTEHEAGAAGNPPRILLVQHTAEPNGSTVSGQMIAQGFQQAGWHVDVVFGSAGAGASRYAEAGCNVHYCAHKNWLRGGGIVRSPRRVFREVAGSRDLVTLMRICRPDLVYVNTIVSLAAAVAARRLGLPCIWHIRELFNDVGGEMQIPPLVGKRLVRSITRRLADRVVVISRAQHDNVLGPYPRENVWLIPNAAADEFFSLGQSQQACRVALGLPQHVPIIGVPGTLRPVKGHEFFLKAAARVAALDRSCVFAVTGDGEPDFVGQIRRLADDLGLGPYVRFLGPVSNMKQFYQACDIVCVPSRAEAFGRTVVEAFAAGVPVVATAVGGITETVEHGTTGLLVDYGDVEGLSAAMLSLTRDSAMRARLSNAARRRAISDFSSVQCSRRINELVQQVLAERRGASAG